MNTREYPRVTTLALPKANEENLRAIIRLFNEAITTLAKRDEDKEKRIRELEGKVRPVGRRNFPKYFGENYRINVTDDDPPLMVIERSTDNWVTIAATTQIAP